MLKDFLENAAKKLEETKSVISEESKIIGSKLSDSIKEMKENMQEAEERRKKEAEESRKQFDEKIARIREEEKRKEEEKQLQKQKEIEEIAQIKQKVKTSQEVIKLNQVESEKYGIFHGDIDLAYFNKVNTIFRKLIADDKNKSDSFKIDSFDEKEGKLLFHNEDYSFSISNWRYYWGYGSNVDTKEDERIEITNKDKNTIWLQYISGDGLNRSIVPFEIKSSFSSVTSLSFGFNEDYVSCMNVFKESSKYYDWAQLCEFLEAEYFYFNYIKVKKILEKMFTKLLKAEQREYEKEERKAQLEKEKLEKEHKNAQKKAFDSF